MNQTVRWARLVVAVLASNACRTEPRQGTEELLPGLGELPDKVEATGWESYGKDPGQSRASPITVLDSITVRQLVPAWRWWTGDSKLRLSDGSEVQPGAFQASALVVRDTVYVVTPLHRVAALAAATGKELWRFDPKTPADTFGGRGSPVHRGLAMWTDGNERRLFLATHGHLLAIDAGNGQLVSGFGDGGMVSLISDLPWVVDSGDVSNTSPPVVYRDLVITGFTVPDRLSYERDPPGALVAVDARTSRRVWTWSPMPSDGDPASKTWGAGSAARTGHMNVWSPFTVDMERGLLFVPVSAPSNDYYGGDRPGDNLYSSSLVCLDAATGRLRWHFQLTHHDVWDYEPAAPPVLVSSRRGDVEVAAVAQASKSGFVFVFDRETGAPLWPIEERPVAASSVAGEQLSLTQPFPTRPAPVARQGITESDLIDFTPALHAQAVALLRRTVHGGLYTPPSTQGTMMLPGWIGGAGWGATAYDPNTRTLYVKTTEAPTLIRLIAPGPLNPKIQGRWVRDTSYASQDPELRIPAPGLIARLLGRSTSLPVLRPPYGRLTAIDMDDGEQRWQIPIGDTPRIRNHPALAGLKLPPLGVAGAPGPSLTASGLVFLTGGGSTLIAVDGATGTVLWSHELGGPGYANPVLYQAANGRPYVLISVGGPGQATRLMAFTIR